jgi:predicted DNA-binding antitoxin AbrB/MazE fold protein
MNETVTAVYEKGVLRPLTPLSLPESTRVRLQIIDQTPADQEQLQVRRALLDAGLIRPRVASEPAEPVSEAQLT